MVETSDDRADMLVDWDTMYIGTVPIVGVFNNEYTDVDFGDVVQASSDITFTVQTSDVEQHNIKRGIIMKREGKSYRVVNIMDDGQGITVLDLELQ